jgi:hypothetical protein
MPAVQTTYPTNISPAVAGQPASMSGWDVDTKICETAAGIGFGLAVSQTATADTAASGTLTGAVAAPSDGETVTIDGKVYTFKTALTDVDGNVLIGASFATALANLSAAINLGAGAGTLYAASTTLHPTVVGNGASPLVVTAKISGAGGNAITTTETGANLSWGGATLSGGVTGAVGSAYARAVTLGGAAFCGISTRDVTIRVGSAVDVYKQNENMGVMVRGDIWVQVLQEVKVGDTVKFNATTGQLGDSAGTAITAARYMTAAGPSGLAIVRLNLP